MKLEEIRRKAKIKPSAQTLAVEKQFFSKKTAPGSYEMIELTKIDLDPNNPRTSMDPDALKQLADSIREKGIIHPVNLFQLNDGRYRIEEGHRRFEAAKLASLTHLPAIIIMADDLTEQEIRERQLIENLHNEALAPIDAARAIKSLQDKHSLSIRAVAKKIALARSTVQDYVGILRIPDELLERCQGLPLRSLIPISGAAVSDMPDLIEAAKTGSTSEQVKTLRREKKPLSYFRQSYKLKSWSKEKSGSEVVVKLKNIEAGEDVSEMVAKILTKLAREIRQANK